MKSTEKNKNSLLKYAFLTTLPVLAGYLVLGSGFGLILSRSGYGVGWAFFMSIFMYAGSMQYLGAALMAAGADIYTVVITTLLVQARHSFYGISLIEKYRGAGLKKLYMIHAITDETYSLVSTVNPPKNIDRHKFYFYISLLDHCYWIFGCTLGCVLGETLPINTKGVEFALTALFICIFTDKWLTDRSHSSALIGVFSTVICLLCFGAEKFLIPAMLLITLLLPSYDKLQKRHAATKADPESSATAEDLKGGSGDVL